MGRRPLELIHGAEMNDLGAFTTTKLGNAVSGLIEELPQFFGRLAWFLGPRPAKKKCA